MKQDVIAVALGVLATAFATDLGAQQPRPVTPSLVFNGVTVVDVQNGRLLPGQRVVVTGTRITAVGKTNRVKVPLGARMVDARSKYLIPGLWDMHVHPGINADVAYPLFIASGVTGIRDAGSPVPLDTLRRWRQEILAGKRVGPVRQILSGQSIGGPEQGCVRHQGPEQYEACVVDSADAVYYVDSLKAAGADMVKPRAVSHALYFAIAAEARRLGIPFGGHAKEVTATEASDSGAVIIDHMNAKGLGLCVDLDSASVERCRPVADRLRQNGTWFVPTLWTSGGYRKGNLIKVHFYEVVERFWSDSARHRNWFHPLADPFSPADEKPKRASVDSAAHVARVERLVTTGRPVRIDPGTGDEVGVMSIPRQVGLPILAGTDVVHVAGNPPNHWPVVLHLDNRNWGISLHAELAMLTAEGLTPLGALQAATLNPAKMWHATDSLGTVAPGKLADLVLLDANPLADITNTTTIRAVVANGHYFDRAALDRLVNSARARAEAETDP